jgi:hypothetical protein
MIIYFSHIITHHHYFYNDLFRQGIIKCKAPVHCMMKTPFSIRRHNQLIANTVPQNRRVLTGTDCSLC